MELGMYFFENLFFEYLPVLISGSGAGEETESFFCAVQEMGRLGPKLTYLIESLISTPFR